MSTLGFLLKRKELMKKQYTTPVRIGKYVITSHAQNRIVDQSRNLKKIDLINTLFRPPLWVGKTETRMVETPSKVIVGRSATIKINPFNNNIITIWKTGQRKAKKYGFNDSSKKYAKSDNKRRKSNYENASEKQKAKWTKQNKK